MANDPNQELFDAVVQAESRGKRYDSKGKLLEGPKTKYGTAKGEAQVLDTTNMDPGFGVTPAKNNSPDERARVGKDYLNAMLIKYDGNKERALMAYNWGPGNTDRWLSGGQKAPIPKETQNYVATIMGSLGATQQAKAPTAPPMPMQAAGAAASSNPKAPAPRVLSQAAPTATATPAPAVSRETMLATLGPGYQAAVALSYLADNTDEDDPEIQALRERTEPGPGAAYLAEKSKPSPFASLDLSVTSPFAEPVARMADGGVVHRADGTPPEGEKPQVDNTASAKAAAMLRGFGDSAYSLAGAPVDVISMAMRPFGYSAEKPVLGSDWIKQKAEEYGIRPGEEADPQLNRLRQGSEFVSSFVNPAVPVRAAAAAMGKTGKSAEMLRGLTKAEPAPALAQTEEPAFRSLSAMSVNKGNTATPFYSKLDEQAQTLTGPIAPAEFIKQLQNKGFRGYEIERAKEAMKSLGDQRVEPAQILGALDKTYHPESYITHISEPGTVGHTWGDVDNVLGGMGDKRQPQGVVSLHLPITEEMSNTKKLYDHLEDMRVLTPKIDSTAIKSKNIMDTITTAYKLIEKENGADNPITKKAATNLLYAKKMAREKAPFMELFPEYTKLKNEFMYPMQENNSALFSQLIDKKVKDVRARIVTITDKNPDMDFIDALNQLSSGKANLPFYEKMGKGPKDSGMDTQAVYAWATQDVINDFRTATGNKLVPLLRQMGFTGKNELDFFKNPVNANEAGWQPGKTMMEMEFLSKEKVLNDDLAEFQDSVKHGLRWFQSNLPRRLMPVTRHAELFSDRNMKPRPNTNPIAFSRFTDTSTQLNGQKLNGMFVPELQSDLLRSVRERGPAGKSVSDDLPKINKLTEELYAAEKEMRQITNRPEFNTLGSAYDTLTPSGDNLAAAYLKARDKYNSLGAKLQAIGNRTYDVTPAFAGMEDSPQVVQQLMAKNVVLSGIKRNKNFVAFPGAESDQAQIYEKLPRNLEQVVKDLGPGFELQMVEVPLPAGVSHTKLYKMGQAGTIKFPTDANGIVIKDAPPVMMAPAIVWGPEAAARIMKQGVRFATGGMVERQPDDNRRYL
jgi:hypothetical protein